MKNACEFAALLERDENSGFDSLQEEPIRVKVKQLKNLVTKFYLLAARFLEQA